VTAPRAAQHSHANHSRVSHNQLTFVEILWTNASLNS